MEASYGDISSWFDRGLSQGATHMVVKCDSFDSPCCYPVFVRGDQDVHDVVAKNSDRTMEVYNLSMSKQSQMDQTRAFNY